MIQLRSIAMVPCRCDVCGWRGTVSRAVPDIDGDGSLGCPVCEADDKHLLVKIEYDTYPAANK